RAKTRSAATSRTRWNHRYSIFADGPGLRNDDRPCERRFFTDFRSPLDVSAGHSSRAEVAHRLSISSLVILLRFQALDHAICTGFKLMPSSQAGTSEFDRRVSF